MIVNQLTDISHKSQLFFVRGSQNKLTNYWTNMLCFLKDTSCIFDCIPKKFTITTKNGSCKFNTNFLIETSSTISNFIKEVHPELKYDLNIEDPRNVLGKFEQLYEGKKVIFEEEDLQTSFEITEKLSILCCPNYMKPANLRCLERTSNYMSNSNDLKYGVEMKGLDHFLNNFSFQTFTIKTAKNQYKCNIFGVYLSDVIRAQLEKDPSNKEYYYDFEDDEKEFNYFCKLFNFKSVKITKDNMDVLKAIAEDLQIRYLIKDIDKFINDSGKMTQTIDDQQTIIDSIDELFEWLYDIREKTVEEVKNLIIESQWIETEENVQELAAFIIEVVKTDNLLQPYLIDLIIELDEQSNQFQYLQILKPFIISKLLKYFKDDTKGLFVYSFIYKLYKKQLILKEQLIELLKDYDHQNMSKNLWFLPLLYEIDKNCINSIFPPSNDDQNDSTSRNNDKLQMKKFIEFYLPDKIDVYEKMLDNGEPCDIITKSIRDDDVDTLQSFLTQRTIKTKLIPFNVFDDFSIMRNQNNQESLTKTKFLNYAASFGSLKCFKYLLLNYESIDYKTFEFAVYGGNNEIIKIVDQNYQANQQKILKNKNTLSSLGVSISNSIYISILKHRNDLFDWIYERSFDKRYADSIVSFAAEHGNAHSIAEIIFKGYCFTNNIQGIISKTTENGFYRLTKLLLKVFDENSNFSKKYRFPYVNSVSYGNLSIFKLFIKSFDFSEIEKAVIYSINYNYDNIVNYFFELIEKKEIIPKSISKILESTLSKTDDKLFKELLDKFQQTIPDLELTSKFYIHLLKAACFYHNFEGVKTITEKILQINSNEDFSIPFCQSAVIGSIELCQYFIDEKVKIDYNQLKSSSYSFGLLNKEIFSIILKNINPIFKNQFLASIKSAIINKNIELVDYLFKENAKCDNALSLAIDSNDIELVNIVLKYNNKPYLLNKIGSNGTALIHAVNNNNLQIVKRLLETPGIDPGLYMPNQLEYPIIYAIRNQNLDIINAILDFYGENIQYQKQQLEEIFREAYKYYCFKDTEMNPEIKSIINRILDIKYINLNYVFTNCFYNGNKERYINPNANENNDENDNNNFGHEFTSDDEFSNSNNNNSKALFDSNNDENCLIYSNINNCSKIIDDDFTEEDEHFRRDICSNNTFLLTACIRNDFNMVKKLLSLDSIDANCYSFGIGDTALITAVKLNNFQIVKLLVEHPKTNINQRNFFSKTPLIYAVINRSEEIVNLLINDNKFDPDESNIDVAFEKANWELMKILISSKSFDFNKIKAPILSLAIQNNDIKTLDFVIHHPSFDKNKFESYLINSIITSIKKYKFDIFVELMQFINDDVNLIDFNGKSLLIHSVCSLNIKVIDYILNNKHFDPFKSDLVASFAESYSSKASLKIHEMRKNEYLDEIEDMQDLQQQPQVPLGNDQKRLIFIRMFIQSTADVMTVINRLYDYDVAHGHLIDFNKLLPNGKSFFTSFSQSFNGIEAVSDFLLSHGADPNLPDKNKTYPFANAIEIRSYKLVLSLIESNKIDFSVKIPITRFNYNQKTSVIHSTTYLHIAAKSVLDLTMKEILKRNLIDINATDDFGNTPLMEACIHNNLNVIKLLFEDENLDFLHRNKEGKDAIDLMMNKENEDVKRESINDKNDYLNKLEKISRESNKPPSWR